MCFLKKILPEYAVSFCLRHQELDKKRALITWKRSNFDQAFRNDREYCQINKQYYLLFSFASLGGLAFS